MTHAQITAAVRASLMLAPSRADRQLEAGKKPPCRS